MAHTNLETLYQTYAHFRKNSSITHWNNKRRVHTAETNLSQRSKVNLWICIYTHAILLLYMYQWLYDISIYKEHNQLPLPSSVHLDRSSAQDNFSKGNLHFHSVFTTNRLNLPNDIHNIDSFLYWQPLDLFIYIKRQSAFGPWEI